MEINLMAVLFAAVGMFAFGAFWYTYVFGNLWSRMHGFDKLSKARQDEMASKMNPTYAVQFVVTLLGALMLAKLITLLPDYSPYTLAFLVWLGFAVPAHVSDVLFGGTESKWLVKKIVVTSLATLGYLLVAVAILNLFQ